MYLRQSIRIVNNNLIFIPFLALSGIVIMSPTTETLSISLSLMSFIFYPVVYGRLVETIMNLSVSTWTHLLKVYWFNYLLVIGVLVIPVIIINYLISSLESSLQRIFIKTLFEALLSCVTIYVLPIVFTRRQLISSISLGIKTLFNLWRRSISLILLTLCIFIIKISVRIIMFINWPINLPSIFVIGFFQNFINAYIHLIVFCTALFILKEQGEPTHLSI